MKKKILSLLDKRTLLFLIKILNFIYKKSYSLMTTLGEELEGENKHPKHRIMQYREWFASNIKQDWTILDIGSNNGHMAYFLSSSCEFVYGIEISQSMVDTANSIYQKENVEYICADATTYNYNDKKIDCVTMSNVLEHIDKRVVFLKKLILQINWKNEPTFLIRVPLIDRDWMPVFLNEIGIDYRLDKTHFIEYTKKSFEEEMNESGLKIVEYHIQWGEIYAVCKRELQ